MKRFVAILVLFVGFSLLLFGVFLTLTGLFPYTKTSSGPCWPIVAAGLGMALGGWALKRGGLSRWRAAAADRKVEQ
jgi:hypothetical protein